jgi:hypothetical protein
VAKMLIPRLTSAGQHVPGRSGFQIFLTGEHCILWAMILITMKTFIVIMTAHNALFIQGPDILNRVTAKEVLLQAAPWLTNAPNASPHAPILSKTAGLISTKCFPKPFAMFTLAKQAHMTMQTYVFTVVSACL